MCSLTRRPSHQIENTSANIRRICPEKREHIYVSEQDALNDQGITGATVRICLDRITFYNVVHPGGVHTSACPIFYWVVEEKGQCRPSTGTVRTSCRFLEKKASSKTAGLPASTGTVR